MLGGAFLRPSSMKAFSAASIAAQGGRLAPQVARSIVELMAPSASDCVAQILVTASLAQTGHSNQGRPTLGIGASQTTATRASLIHRAGDFLTVRLGRGPSRFTSRFSTPPPADCGLHSARFGHWSSTRDRSAGAGHRVLQSNRHTVLSITASRRSR
jgi:hypothetical protein